MTPEEVEALNHISPWLAPYIVVAAPGLALLAYVFTRLPQAVLVRSGMVKLFGWDPGAVPKDDVDRRSLQLVDQLQEELARCRSLIARYGAELEQVRFARVNLMDMLQELYAAAIAARAMVHELERRAGVPETSFDPLPRPQMGSPMAA